MPFQLVEPAELIKCDNLANCLQNLYNLFFAILLVLAFLNFIYGAFQYLLSAGYIFKKEEGKKKMQNSLISVIIVLIIPPLLQLINPQIFEGFNIKIPLVTVILPSPYYNPNIPGSFPGGGSPYSTEILERKKFKVNCKLVEKSIDDDAWLKLNECAPKNFQNLGAPRENEDLLKKLALICFYESRGVSNLASLIDKCQDGYSFSFGLFQINIAANDLRGFKKGDKDGDNCTPQNIFNFEGSNKLRIKEWGSQNRPIYNCRVKDRELYDKCKEIVLDPKNNLNKALALAANNIGLRNWSTWIAGVKDCFQGSQ